MQTYEALSECRFCSEVSKNNGEDPIGTAGTFDYWLLIEMRQPWVEETLSKDPQIVMLRELLKQLFIRHGTLLRPVLIAPDREYSQRESTRVIYYRRPHRQFSTFTKQEYIVPKGDFPTLVEAILISLMKKPNCLDQFAANQVDTSHLREILVCTHGNVDVACAKFGQPIYRKLRQEYNNQVRVWRCSHFGGHKFAPTLIHLPDGRHWGHVEPEMLDLLVDHAGDVEGLRSHYRGWAGLTKFEQIAEREIWMREGWKWLDYQKSGRTLRKGLTGIRRFVYPLLNWIPIRQLQVLLDFWTSKANWAEVEIKFTSADQTASGTYWARVDGIKPVTTAGKSPKSGEAIKLTTSPQYRVSRLVKQ